MHETSSFRWGLEFLSPEIDSGTQDPFTALCAWNDQIIASGELFQLQGEPAMDFDGTHLRFPSAPGIPLPTPEHATAVARVRERRRSRHGGRRAVVILPALTTGRKQYRPLASWLGMAGWSTAVLSLPDHDERAAAGREPGQDLVSPNLGRTLTSMRRAVLDARRVLDWFHVRGYEELALLGVSIGSITAMLTALHEPRVKRVAFTYVTRDLAEPMWDGWPGFRAAVEPHLGLEELRQVWSCLSAPPHLHQCREDLALQIFSGARDTICSPRLTREILNDLLRAEITFKWCELDCDHAEITSPPHVLRWLWDLYRFFRR